MPPSPLRPSVHRQVVESASGWRAAQAASITSGGGIFSKTARGFVDRLLPWLDQHRDVPFFAFLHVFDPHSPFEPYAPWNGVWMVPMGVKVFDADGDGDVCDTDDDNDGVTDGDDCGPLDQGIWAAPSEA
jgi:hypothetical protein